MQRATYGTLQTSRLARMVEAAVTSGGEQYGNPNDLDGVDERPVSSVEYAVVQEKEGWVCNGWSEDGNIEAPKR